MNQIDRRIVVPSQGNKPDQVNSSRRGLDPSRKLRVLRHDSRSNSAALPDLSDERLGGYEVLRAIASSMARYAWSIVESVLAPAPESELAMVIRPNGARPMTCGCSRSFQSGSKKRIVLVGVAVGPAIDRDGYDVGGWIEAARTQGACHIRSGHNLTPVERRRVDLLTYSCDRQPNR
jgi:hypothetical protein